MKTSYTAIAAAMVGGWGLLCGAAQAQSMPEFKFSGFGTVAAVHSSEKNADFVGTVFQPNGAGYTSAWSLAPDSKLGGQVGAVFNDKFSAVVQVVSQHQYDNSFTPMVEWANLKYQVTPEFSLRLGRIALPSYLLSESRFVGYASPWVRPPDEVYSVLPITSNDGVDATYRSQIGGVNNTLQAYYGKSSARVPGSTTAKSNPSWGLNDSVEFGSFTLRAGYSSMKLDLDGVTSLDPIFNGLKGLSAGLASVPMPAFQTASAEALALVEKYKLNGMALSAIALGVNYDPGTWFVMSELVALKGDGFLANSRSWYLSSGYRFGNFTPYATYSSTKADVPVEPGISTAGLAAVPPLAAGAAGLNAGLNTTLGSFNSTQSSFSLGLRWDFMKNMALKTQYDRLSISEDSHGRLRNTQPGFQPGGKVDVVSVALDFVF